MKMVLILPVFASKNIIKVHFALLKWRFSNIAKGVKNACDSVVQTALPLVADERSRHKRPFLLPFADAGRYPRTH